VGVRGTVRTVVATVGLAPIRPRSARWPVRMRTTSRSGTGYAQGQGRAVSGAGGEYQRPAARCRINPSANAAKNDFALR